MIPDPQDIEELNREAKSGVQSTSPDQQHRGQVRIAYRLAESHSDRLMHVHGLGWYHYDGRRWMEDTGGHAKRAVLDVLRRALAESLADHDLRTDVRKCESSAGVAGVLDLATALPEFAFTVDALDADPYLLNTANGTLDLRTLDLRTHDPRDRITKVTRAGYQPGSVSPEWSQFLQRVLPDVGVREFLRRYTGVDCAGACLNTSWRSSPARAATARVCSTAPSPMLSATTRPAQSRICSCTGRTRTRPARWTCSASGG